MSRTTEVNESLSPVIGYADGSGGSGSLVTSRNNCNSAASAGRKADSLSAPGAFRWPRSYVQRCGQGSLALFHTDGRVRFTALACGSWSCPTCRKRLAARLLDRTRRGMESRPEMRRWLVTLTCDPIARGAVPLGRRVQLDGRVTNIVSEPTPEQFADAVRDFQANWTRLRASWAMFCKRRGWDRPGFLRVVELHRNGWPHWHIVVEHEHLSTAELQGMIESGWKLGRTDVRETDTAGAVGEIVPYLVSAERKAGGDKAYQFAAFALPKNMRLWSSSQGFLAEPEEESLTDVEHGVAVAGDVSSWYAALEQVAEQRIWLMQPPQADGSYRAPDAFVAAGGNVVAFYAELVRAKSLQEKLNVTGFLRDFGLMTRDSDGNRDETCRSAGLARGRESTAIVRSAPEFPVPTAPVL